MGVQEVYWDELVRENSTGKRRPQTTTGSARASANATGSSRIKAAHEGRASKRRAEMTRAHQLGVGAMLILASEGDLKGPCALKAPVTRGSQLPVLLRAEWQILSWREIQETHLCDFHHVHLSPPLQERAPTM